MNKVIAWMRQPTTVAGLSALSGTAVALLGAQMSRQSSLPLLVASFVGIVLPDNAGAKLAIGHLVADAVQAEQLVVNPQSAVAVMASGELSTKDA
ncbi:MAG: hypothetical protein ACRYHQ_14900 [Janthinobacterium lividum]